MASANFGSNLLATMTTVSSNLTNVNQFLQTHTITTYVGLVFVTVGLQQITQLIFSDCPEDQLLKKLYPCACIFGPAIILLLLGIIFQRRTWIIIQGYSNNYNKLTCGYFMSITGKAFLLLIVWICVAFLDGRYFACFQSFNETQYLNSTTNDVVVSENYYKFLSICLGWLLSSFLMLLIFIGMCYRRCSSSNPFYLEEYLKIYGIKEREAAFKFMQEHMDAIIEKRKAVFQQSHTFTFDDWNLLSRIDNTDESLKTTISPQNKSKTVPLTPHEAWFKNKSTNASVV